MQFALTKDHRKKLRLTKAVDGTRTVRTPDVYGLQGSNKPRGTSAGPNFAYKHRDIGAPLQLLPAQTVINRHLDACQDLYWFSNAMEYVRLFRTARLHSTDSIRTHRERRGLTLTRPNSSCPLYLFIPPLSRSMQFTYIFVFLPGARPPFPVTRCLHAVLLPPSPTPYPLPLVRINQG